MKNVMIGLLGFYISLLGSTAMADGNWSPVLTCDGTVADGRPTVEVDNMGSSTGGRLPQSAASAQVVIRNPQIVQYFVSALAMQPTAFAPFTHVPINYSGSGFTVQDGQWIAASGDQTFPAGLATRSFTVANGPYGSSVAVNYDGTGLTVVVNVYGDWNHDVTTSTANWNFHNCIAQ